MSNVIKQIQKKNDDNSFSSPINLGADQRFVGALRQSNNDNLEEQSILGLDCVTTESWNDDRTEHTIRKEFHDGTKSNNYYILTTVIKNEVNDSYVDGTRLVLADSYVNPATSFSIIRTDTLSFKNSSNQEIIISVKTTKRKEVDGIVTTTEVIDRKI